jgi:hypothetical protein
MCALLDPEIRQWLDISAEYLTAVGTVGAVIVALYLARKDRREKISVSAAIHHFVPPGRTFAESIRSYGLTATNVGFATLTAQNLCWRVGVFRKKVLYVIPPSPLDQGSTDLLPKTLRRGDWLTVRTPEQQFINGLASLLQEVSEHPFPTLALRSIRAGIETSTKKRFIARLNWDVAKILREQFDTLRKTRARPCGKTANRR